MSWSWLDPAECFQSHAPHPELELSTNTTMRSVRRTLIPISLHNSVAFNITDLDCNQFYLPTVRATISGIRVFEKGNEIFFGGTSTLEGQFLSSKHALQ